MLFLLCFTIWKRKVSVINYLLGGNVITKINLGYKVPVFEKLVLRAKHVVSTSHTES